MEITEKTNRLSGPILTRNENPLDRERREAERFARNESVPEYRPQLEHLYATWQGFNGEHFDNRLMVPHISIGRTAPRRFSQCRRTTNQGGQIDITISESIAFGTNRVVVRRGYPAPGFLRFIDDLLLAETVKQIILEIHGVDEAGYGGYGPLFAAEANRIGSKLGLPEVPARRRGHRGASRPVAAFWPWALRPEGYYLGDIQIKGRQIAGLRSRPNAGRVVAASIEEYYLYLLIRGQADRLRSILERQVDADRAERTPGLAASERGPLSSEGRILPVPIIQAYCLLWNDGCVARIGEHITLRRAFDVMPILADALEDAGCDSPEILLHLRQPALHTRNCWVLKAIREAANALS